MRGQAAQPERVDDDVDEIKPSTGTGMSSRLRHRRLGAGSGGRARAREKLVKLGAAARDELAFYESEEGLVEAAIEEIGIAEPEVSRAIRRYGLAVVEGALFATANAGELRSPIGWFFTTCRDNYWWTAAEVERHVERNGALLVQSADDYWLRKRKEEIERVQAASHELPR